MSPSSLSEKINGIMDITGQMLAAQEGNDWDKVIEQHEVLDTELHSLFSQPIAEQDAGMVREMIEKVMEAEQRLRQSAVAAKDTIHTASKKMSNEKAALAAYAHSLE